MTAALAVTTGGLVTVALPICANAGDQPGGVVDEVTVIDTTWPRQEKREYQLWFDHVYVGRESLIFKELVSHRGLRGTKN